MDADGSKATFWRDSRGKVVIGQWPNLPLAAWFVLTAVSLLLGSGAWRSGSAFAGSAFLFVWAYLELRQGVNYFRRLLGLVVLVAVAAGHFR